MTAGEKLINRWFPVSAVDAACRTSAGSGQNEKALFTWFASRPIAQARAAVICSVLEEQGDDPSAETIELIERAIRIGDPEALDAIAARVPDVGGKRPVVLDCFSGRGIIPLEAARLGFRAVGIDLSPVAVLASRILGDWALRDWSCEPDVPYAAGGTAIDDADVDDDRDEAAGLYDEVPGDPKLISDLRRFFSEIDRRVERAVRSDFPRNTDGTYPWGYLWAITIPCDRCKRRFPLLGSLVLRHPYKATGDPGQSCQVETDDQTGQWAVVVDEGVPTGRPTFAAAGKKGKTARCPFCEHSHPLNTVKAKGFAGQYEDAPLLAAQLNKVEVENGRGGHRTVERKTFRMLRPDEVEAAVKADPDDLAPFGDLPAVPDEVIAAGNNHAIRASAYGFRTFGELMHRRQLVLIAETATAIRSASSELLSTGLSSEYVAALAGCAGANLVRRLRYSTRGSRLRAVGKPSGAEQNRNKMGDLFSNEGSLSFNFDWFETGPGKGPGTWSSLSTTTLTPLRTHILGLTSLAAPGTFRRDSATNLPYRDGTVDVAVIDPPYYKMVDYADISDLFYVWLRRTLLDFVPDLFAVAGGEDGLQDKAHEIIVKDSAGSTGDHRTTDWYEEQMAAAFVEIRRVLKPGGTMTVVFGHSDPDAWLRLLGALRNAQFVVTSAWPSRTEAGDTGVASIKVTVTIGCRVAPAARPTATAAQVEREIIELVRKLVPRWDAWELALADQRMAAYGPAMQVVGRYRQILRPDPTEPPLDHFLAVGRRAVADAHAFRIDELPLDTFDAQTRFSLFWLRAYGRTYVNKGEALFEAQSAELRIDDLRSSVLEESEAGFALTLEPPARINDRSSVVHVARALAAEWVAGGTDGAATVIAHSGRDAQDAHVWATVGELVRQLPASDRIGMALTACQRNRGAITSTARRLGSGSDAEQLTIDMSGDAP